MFQKRILYDCNNTHILYKIIVCGVCATAVLHLVDTVRGKRVAKAKAGMAAMREGDDNNDNHGDDANRGNASRGDGVSRSNSRGGGVGVAVAVVTAVQTTHRTVVLTFTLRRIGATAGGA